MTARTIASVRSRPRHSPSTLIILIPSLPAADAIIGAGLRGELAMPLVPIVIERSGREERAIDIYSRLLKDRIIILRARSTTTAPT